MSIIEVMGNRTDESDGPGRLAIAIANFPHGIDDLRVETVSTPSEADFPVYCRKVGDTAFKAVEYSSETGTPLLFLSSGMNDRIDAIEAVNFPLIVAPNAALEVIGFMNEVESAWTEKYKGWIPHIVEHHQESKADISGTAIKLTQMLGVGKEHIESVRDFYRSQEEFDIPDSSRDGYAVHVVTFTHPTTGETSEPIEVVVRGRGVYAQGVIDIYDATKRRPEAFSPGRHNIVDLVKNGIVVPTRPDRVV